MPISIDFLANVRGFLRGTDDVDEALSRVSSSLDDVARDGARSTDRLADSTERSTERMERSFQELADASRREMDSAADAGRRSFDRTSRSARENLQEVKNEALQNASETFSSFDGSVRSFADGVQGTLGGLIASLPAQWAAVGAAGALGLGLLLSGLERSDEQTQELTDPILAAATEQEAAIDHGATQVVDRRNGETELRGDARRADHIRLRDEGEDVEGAMEGLDAPATARGLVHQCVIAAHEPRLPSAPGALSEAHGPRTISPGGSTRSTEIVTDRVCAWPGARVICVPERRRISASPPVG